MIINQKSVKSSDALGLPRDRLEVPATMSAHLSFCRVIKFPAGSIAAGGGFRIQWQHFTVFSAVSISISITKRGCLVSLFDVYI